MAMALFDAGRHEVDQLAWAFRRAFDQQLARRPKRRPRTHLRQLFWKKNGVKQGKRTFRSAFSAVSAGQAHASDPLKDHFARIFPSRADIKQVLSSNTLPYPALHK